jgi:hypothetical protein
MECCTGTLLSKIAVDRTGNLDLMRVCHWEKPSSENEPACHDIAWERCCPRTDRHAEELAAIVPGTGIGRVTP